MNNKENALRTIRFDHPERIMRGAPCHVLGYLGVDHNGWDGRNHDSLPVGAEWTEVWGVTWRKDQDGVMGYPVHHPLADIRQVDRFAFPDPDDERLLAPVYAKAKSWAKSDTFLSGSHRCTLFERANQLVGMDALMVAFYEEPEAVRTLLRRLMDFNLGMARHYIGLGVELAHLGDDHGTQTSLLLSPKILRTFFVPEYRRLFDLYKSHGVLIDFHCCGHVEPLLDTLMDLGVDLLNPLQASANDLAAVRRKTAGRMTLCGGIPSPLIESGTPSAIRAEVRKRIWQLGQEGGYFCNQDHGLKFPPANVAAFNEALETYGHYPLTAPDESEAA